VNKAVFLDRDGTINMDWGYVYRKETFRFLPGVIEGLKILASRGYLLIVITNQSGIARGYYGVEDFEKLNAWMIEQLIKQGIFISKVYYCPHHPHARIKKYRMDCTCRKPGIGLFEQAIREFCIDTDKSYAIGDKKRDLEICRQTGIKGYCIYSEEKEDGNITYIEGGLLEAAKEITGYGGGGKE